MYISCGITFNHEGEYRNHEYVSRKISSNIARISLGMQERFTLGDLTTSRDWGYAGDYVEAMWLMLQEQSPDDYVIATGRTHTVKEFVQRSLNVAGLHGKIEDYVEFDQDLSRPPEKGQLVGDASKIKAKLGWEPKVNFDQLVELMVTNDLRLESAKEVN
jgi:GDPmannose 4,6-dehydratase